MISTDFTGTPRTSNWPVFAATPRQLNTASREQMSFSGISLRESVLKFKRAWKSSTSTSNPLLPLNRSQVRFRFGFLLRHRAENVRGLSDKILQPFARDRIGDAAFFPFVFRDWFAPAKANPARGQGSRAVNELIQLRHRTA